MDTYRRHDVRSRGAIFGHPLHPMLIPFPIAFLVGVLVTDVVFWRTGNAFWAQASFWLVTAGAVTGLVAAVPGLIDFVGIRRVRELGMAWVHAGGNVLAVAISLVSVYLRWNDPAAAVLPWGLVLSLAVAAILGVTGWIGGEMSYRHGIGFAGTVADVEDAEGTHVDAVADPRTAPTVDARDWREGGGRNVA